MLTERHEQKLNRLRDELTTHTAFSNWTESSRVRFLAEVFIREIIRSERSIETIITQNQIETAGGAFLDSIAIESGIVRLPQRKAADATDNVSISRAGDAGSTTVPQGTRISALSSNQGALINYQTLADVALTNTQTSFVGVEAEVEGPQSNIGSSLLQVIDFTPASGVTITATNSKPITNGRYEETDAELRFRLVSSVAAAVPGTILALRSFLDSSSEIISHRIEERPNEVIITIQPREISNSGFVTASLQEALRLQVPAGTTVTLQLPAILAANVTANIAVRPGTSVTVIKQNVAALIIQYINGKTIGSPIRRRDIDDIIRSQDQVTSHSISTLQGQMYNYEISNVTERTIAVDSNSDTLEGEGAYLFIPGSIVINGSS